MPSHRSHTQDVYMEPERHDELSKGVPAQATASDPRKPGGQLAQGAKNTPSKGGKATKGSTQLSHRIEGPLLTEQSVRRARTLRRVLSGEVASTVGGGVCGVAASLFIKFAAQKTAAAEEAFQRGDYEAHRKLSESARMDLLYAREHAAKEAAARPSTHNPHEALAALMSKGGP
jgi:hypothetical protein